MGHKRPTVYDVAQRAGVSTATVSFAFRRPTEVRDQTRALVLNAAKEIGYVPSASARGLAKGATGALGLHSLDWVLDRPEGSTAEPRAVDRYTINDDQSADPRAFPLYVDEVQRGFELECRDLGLALVMSNGLTTDAAVADAAGRVDALAVFPGTATLEALAHLPESMPVVLLSSPPAHDRYHRVLVNNAQGIRNLATHLLDDHHLTKIEFVGSQTVPEFAERFRAFKGFMADRELPARAAPIDETLLHASKDFAGLTRALLQHDLPQALMCANDQIALEVIDFLGTHDINVPGDIVVTGFDGILAGRLSIPTLTTVRQPMTAMGRLAALTLVEELKHPSHKPQIHRLDAQVIQQGSCGCTAE